MEVYEWPYDDEKTTYIVGSEKNIDLFIKSKKVQKQFIADLKDMGDIPVRKKTQFVIEEGMSDEFIYVVDAEGIQLVVEMEWKNDLKSKKDFDFTKYDA